MSVLAPLYVLGALAVAAPIVFHLIRRTPRGEVPFGSLMFLSPTPPRLTRRSRLDDWLLLLLRAAALVLLAVAFARPFLRQPAALDPADAERRRVVVLVDASASLRRAGLWDRAKAAATEAIDGLRPGDRLAVLTFDTATRPLLGFAESATLEPSRRQAVARSRLASAEPGWKGTDLGRALIDAVAATEDVADATEKAARTPRRIVLVTDLQRGADLDALGTFEWPPDVELELKTVAAAGSNATPQTLVDAAGGVAAGDVPLRVRVANEAGSDRERFRLRWDGPAGGAAEPVEVYVPPGESRVASVPRPTSGGGTLRLEGDAQPFDNAVYVANAPPREAAVLFVGPDAADDPDGLLYYLDRVYATAPGRTIEVRPVDPAKMLTVEAAAATPLAVLAAPTTSENAAALRAFAEAGGTVLCVVRSPDQAANLAALAGVPAVGVEEATGAGDAMLAEIAFDHPLFAPLAGPQYNDFTKIRFWKHRKVDAAGLGDARVLARFEGGDPAVIEKPLGKGRLVVFAAGWNPADGQLARSSKFVPLAFALLDGPGGRPANAAGLVVGDPAPLPAGHAGLVVRKPDGETATVAAGVASFTGTDLPGVYTIEGADRPAAFAVNLDPAEGRTAPLPPETLERLGVTFAGRGPREATPEQKRQMRNAELEGRQKLWRWLVVAAVAVLIAETWLAGRRGRPAREGAMAA